jgi:uncharacterized protein YigA (DUF484 family)
MRENIDLFKDNMKVLREQNDELQHKLSKPLENGHIKELFEGLKEDNMRLADEVKRF